jgi:hypothetical protein
MSETQVVEYNVTNAAIAEMKDMYMGLVITDLEDTEQYKVVHTAHMTVRGVRIDVDKKRKELKSDALAWGKKVQTEANRIFALIEPIETHLKGEKARVQDEKDRIEREHQEAIDAKILHIRTLFVNPYEHDAETIKELIDEIESIKIEPGEYFDKTIEANAVKQEVLVNACAALQGRERMDADDARQAAEDARLAVELAELEKAKVEQDEKNRVEREKQIAEQAKVKAENDRIAAEQKAAQDIIDKQNATITAEYAKLEAERLKAEHEKMLAEVAKESAEIGYQAGEYARLAEIERKEDEIKDNAAAEKWLKEEADRQLALLPDKEKIEGFCQYLEDGITYPETNSAEARQLIEQARLEIELVAAELWKKNKAM